MFPPPRTRRHVYIPAFASSLAAGGVRVLELASQNGDYRRRRREVQDRAGERGAGVNEQKAGVSEQRAGVNEQAAGVNASEPGASVNPQAAGVAAGEAAEERAVGPAAGLGEGVRSGVGTCGLQGDGRGQQQGAHPTHEASGAPVRFFLYRQGGEDGLPASGGGAAPSPIVAGRDEESGLSGGFLFASEGEAEEAMRRSLAGGGRGGGGLPLRREDGRENGREKEPALAEWRESWVALGGGRRLRVHTPDAPGPPSRPPAAIVSFHDLCVAPLGPTDYLTLARAHPAIGLAAVPRCDAAVYRGATYSICDQAICGAFGLIARLFMACGA
jgi:hypothetical protein